MSTDENKAIVHWFAAQAWKGNVAVVDDLTTPDYTFTLFGLIGPLDRAGFKHYASTLRVMLPAWQLTAEDLIAEGDKVVLRWRAQGPRQGDLPPQVEDLHPVGSLATVMGVSIYRLASGKIAEEQAIADTLELLRALSSFPTAGQSGA